MTYPDGRPASLYSGYNATTVRRHFQWMSDYGVDGVFVQRFGSELTDPARFATRNQVTNNARAGAEAYGRVFAMMCDTSGMHTDTFVQIIEDDWKFMVDEMKVTESSAYLQHRGQPVLAIWGLGFTEHPGTPAQAMELLDFFEHNPDPKYRATLVGGVPTYWITLERDSLPDPGWADYYCGLDVISPWTVGRYTTDLDVDLYQRTMRSDMAAATTCGAEYMPVVHPGTSFHNSSGTPFNLIPRRGGNLYCRQVYNAVSIDVPMIYNAMFDEVDEGTAMYKVAATSADQPVGVDLISMDADGYRLPSDWYLSLAGAASQMRRGEIPVTPKIPLAFEFPPPSIPTGLHRFRVQIRTTSDYVDLTLLSGGAMRDPALVSASPEATRIRVVDNRIAIAQPLDLRREVARWSSSWTCCSRISRQALHSTSSSRAERSGRRQ